MYIFIKSVCPLHSPLVGRKIGNVVYTIQLIQECLVTCVYLIELDAKFNCIFSNVYLVIYEQYFCFHLPLYLMLTCSLLM